MNLDAALNRARELYVNGRELWTKVQLSAMAQDWSWDRSAKDYVALYQRMIGSVRKPSTAST